MLADAESGAGGDAFNANGVCEPCAPRAPPAQPVITPRFVPTCSMELMKGLAQIAKRHNLLVTSHISENLNEISWVKSLHPDVSSYAGCYDVAGLLGERTILAHGVYLGADERALFRDRGASVSHCPLSNCMLRSGMLNVRRLLAEGVNVSLGTDVSGGASPSMLSAIRETQKVSNLVSLVEKAERGDEWAPLTDIEAFYLATVGGAASLGVHGLTGTLTAGAAFDAIVIDPEASGSPMDLSPEDTPTQAFKRWLCNGDDRNTSEVYVQGQRMVEGPTAEFCVPCVPEKPASAAKRPRP